MQLFVRPASHKGYAVYKLTDLNKAKILFTGTRKECYEWIEQHKNEYNDQKTKKYLKNRVV